MVMLYALIPLVVVAALVGAVVYLVARHRSGPAPADPGVGATRRVYFYAVSFASLVVAVNGVVLILDYVVEALFGPRVISGSQTGLAVGMSLALVGLPLWAFHWRVVQRQSAGAAVERLSLVRKVYLYAVLGVSLGVLMAAAVQLLQWAMGLEELSGWPWGAAAAWGAVWAFHWTLEEREGQATEEAAFVRSLYVYLASLAAAVLGVSGLAMIMDVLLSDAYDALFRESLYLVGGGVLSADSARDALAYALVGLAVWGGHWLYAARGDTASAVRGAYVFLFAILGGVLMSVTAAGTLLFRALGWALGAAVEPAADHFDVLPTALTALVIGVAAWAYHWSVGRRDAAAPGPWSARRTYDYLVAVVGLGTLAVGVGWLVHTALTPSGGAGGVPSPLVVESGAQLVMGRAQWWESFSLGATLLALGLPLWGYHWAAAQRRLAVDGQRERGSLERRLYVFAVLGAGAAALLIGGSALLFYLFRDALAADLSGDTLSDAKPALAALAAVALVAPYHWMVYLRDQRERRPEDEPPPRKLVSVLASSDAQPFVGRLEAALGYRVTVLRWADADAAFPRLADQEVEQLPSRIAAAPGGRVLLIPAASGLRIVSYD